MTDDQIKQIKEANDIVGVVGSYVALRSAGGTYKGLCPFHNDHRPSFDVDPRRQRYRCWSCTKFGDVISFVQEHDRVSFRDALELLARRANISLDAQDSEVQQNRARLLEAVRWAAQKYHQCLLDADLAETARAYLADRQLLGPTVRRFGVGFAPATGDWLVQQAAVDRMSLEDLERVGLIAQRTHGSGYYDRFRDRVLFPIREPMGRPVAFGGRILPTSPLASRGPKYYNSPDTPLFSKSEIIYGLDQARQPGVAAGYLAVVEGYTDVLMAHQRGLGQVVATMGTALTVRHVLKMRQLVPKVVLVYDADAGGDTGVDRALAIFASQEVDLAIATLPQGLDPCDLLTQEGGTEEFQDVLANAVDALDFKLQRLLSAEGMASVEGRRRAVESVLGIIALAPEMSGQAGALKRELIVSRISQRLALKEEIVWARLKELYTQRRKTEDREKRVQPVVRVDAADHAEVRQARPAPEERQLLEILLAEPDLVSQVRNVLAPEDLGHPGLRRLLEVLYALHDDGEPPTLDLLRGRLTNPRLAEWAMKHQEIGRTNNDRSVWLQQVLAVFRQRRTLVEKQELHNQLHAAHDHAAALELLRQLQNNGGL